MADYILSLVKVNEEINYSTIVSLIVAYLFFMWFIILCSSFSVRFSIILFMDSSILLIER